MFPLPFISAPIRVHFCFMNVIVYVINKNVYVKNIVDKGFLGGYNW